MIFNRFSPLLSHGFALNSIKRISLIIFTILNLALLFSSDLHAFHQAFNAYWNPLNLEYKQVFNSRGELMQKGWSHGHVILFNKESMPAHLKPRLKEWEKYTIITPDFNIVISLQSLKYLSRAQVDFIPAGRGKIRSASFSLRNDRSLTFPTNINGNVSLFKGDNHLHFYAMGESRKLSFQFKRGVLQKEISGQITISNHYQKGISNITSFEQPQSFLYEHSSPGHFASGEIKVDRNSYEITPGESFAAYEWSRGVWPKQTSWYRGQGALQMSDDSILSFSLGQGYGEHREASSNGFFWQGQFFKVGTLQWIPLQIEEAGESSSQHLGPPKAFRLKSDDGSINLFFSADKTLKKKKRLTLSYDQILYFGHFQGQVNVGELNLKLDNVPGHLEEMVIRKW